MNIEIAHLTINGYGDRPVPNRFVRQREDTTTLVVILPGQGYTADMPLLYYSEWISLERGWDVLRVDYKYEPLEYHDSIEIRKQRLEELKRQLYADVDAAFAAGLDQRDYERIILIGKSLGTRAMGHVLNRDINCEVWNVWLTPLINEPKVREQTERYPGRTFVAIGNKDQFYDREYLAELQAQDAIEVVVIQGADHSMDISGDIFGSIEAMGGLMSRLDAFLPDGSEGTAG